MVDGQTQEKCELLAVENRRLLDENVKLRQANKTLAQQLIERGELVVMLELEAKKAKSRKRSR